MENPKENQEVEIKRSVIDKPVLYISLGITLIFILTALVWPDQSANLFNGLFNLIIGQFSWLYMIGATVFVGFCLVIGLSKYGKIKLGKDDEKPAYKMFSWVAMLFCCGTGIGLLFWCTSEPMMHYAAAPFTDSNTALAAQQALRQSFFHWGIHPWAIYVVVGLSLAYFGFRKDLPPLLSSSLYPFMGEKGMVGPLGKTIDIIAIVCTVFGVATSLGMGAMQVATGLNYLYGIPSSMVTFVVIVLITTVIFIMSSITGINKGIKWLSNINLTMAIILLAFIMTLGPTGYILNTFSQVMGDYLQNIVWMSFFVDSNGETAALTYEGWIGSWTIFYWAWWLAWAPFVGTFIARISRGRTIRQFIFGVLVIPTLFSCIWFSAFGGTALHMELFEGISISAAVAENSTTAIFAMLSNLPLSTFLSLISMLIVLIFFITSADSATYVVSMMSSKGNLYPDIKLKILWGVITASVALLLLLAGGLAPMQKISIAIAFPFLFVMFLCIFSMFKFLGQEKLPAKSSLTKDELQESGETMPG